MLVTCEVEPASEINEAGGLHGSDTGSLTGTTINEPLGEINGLQRAAQDVLFSAACLLKVILMPGHRTSNRSLLKTFRTGHGDWLMGQSSL
ncbi:hypothetical protein NDU88_007583 [Pleurodeles waltl]|uniref:Uncharacterized protein n=1 Tax=Pleurodeles waltl TaxID=8319 RepID=A0AAV7PPQ5_PLEWA|nr:hypothetical protein NDU88_007583 [Pleurodeles waltl]